MTGRSLAATVHILLFIALLSVYARGQDIALASSCSNGLRSADHSGSIATALKLCIFLKPVKASYKFIQIEILNFDLAHTSN